MSAHTPGPWHANILGVYGSPATLTPNISINPVILGRPMNVALAKIPRQGDESEANARLIAAAPDLLEALRALHAACVKDGWPVYGAHPAAMNAALAAIAKATGQKGGA